MKNTLPLITALLLALVAIMGESCTTVKHFSVELGGNAPAVVYDAADVPLAAQKTVDLKFANTGQLCVSPNRCFVHVRVYEQFLEAAAARVACDIQAGSVCINEPHYSVQLPHGGLKQSGVGKDCSRYSLEEYLTLKRVSVLIEG